MDDEEPIGALSALDDLTPQAMRAKWTEYERDAAATAARQRALRQQQMEEGRKRLEQMQIGPSRAEQLFALSAAFASPQRSRGFAGMMGNVMPVLASLAGARNDADRRRADALQRLQEQYLSGQMDDEMSGMTARRQALQALTTLAKPQRQRTGFNPLTGQLTDMDTGTPINPANAPAPPKVGEVRDGYRFKGGDPASKNNWELVGQGGPTQSASGGFRSNIPSGNPLDPSKRQLP